MISGRRIVGLIRWLVFGLIATIAVAWLSAWQGPTHGQRQTAGAIHGPLGDQYGEYLIAWQAFSGITCERRAISCTWYEAEDVARALDIVKFLVATSASVNRNDKDVAFAAVELSPVLPASWGNLLAVCHDQRPIFRVDDARGWPLPALWCGFFNSTDPEPASSFPSSWNFVDRVAGGIPLGAMRSVPISARDARALPIRPIWPGLLVDVLAFAVAGYSLTRIATRIREWRRTRRGLCPRCAYDLCHDLTRGCHECGWNRVPRARTVNLPTSPPND